MPAAVTGRAAAAAAGVAGATAAGGTAAVGEGVPAAGVGDAAAGGEAAAGLQPPAAKPSLLSNFPCEYSYLLEIIQRAGFKVLPVEVFKMDAVVLSALQQNPGGLVLVGRGPGGQPSVSMATGWVSTYSVPGSNGTQEVVWVPQRIELPNTALSAAILELVLATAP
jgi:hypothetical protein